MRPSRISSAYATARRAVAASWRFAPSTAPWHSGISGRSDIGRMIEIPHIQYVTAACSFGRNALMRHYGIGELASVAILAELADPSRFSSSRALFVTAAWTPPSMHPISAARPDT